jgi:peptidoglycan DL-endopeptidase CwlO
MKKKLLVLNTTVMIGLGSVIALPTVQAESNLQTQKAQIQIQRSTIQANLSKANQDLNSVQDELGKLYEQLARAEQAIQDNQNMIVKTEQDMADANAEIQKLESEVAILKAAIEKRNDVLKERAQTYQETGGNVRYLDVLLGSTSFSDFVDRVGAVAKIMNADRGLLEQHEADKNSIEEKQASVQTKLAELTSMKTELEGMQAQIMEQQQQNDQLRVELQQREQENLAIASGLQQEDRSLAAQESSIQAQLAAANRVASGSVTTSTPVIQGVSGNINTVITAGYKYIGNSVYVFGGGRNAYDIANGRFDCSGFVSWAFSQAGVRVGASTDSLKYAGRQVSTSEMRPGDLVFFNTYKKDGHVGIYIGGGQFIGSQSSTGVAIANMSSGYWQNTFNGRVVRVIN